MILNEEKKKSLKFSLFDGICASIMIGFTQDYFTPFLLILGGNSLDVGILSAFSNFFASIIQLKSPDITERLKSRRLIITIFVFFQALILIPIILIALFFKSLLYIFIILVILFNSTGAFAASPWASLMSDLVEENRRGEYFGWRNKILGLITIATTFIAGIILQKMQRFNIFFGFAIIFSLAFIFRIASWYFLTKMYEPPFRPLKEDYFSFFDFLKRAKQSNFVKFVFFVALLIFSVNIASPFFSVFMLKDLKFNYLLYVLVTLSATLTIYLMSSRWGRCADRVGNIKVIRFTSKIISIIPLFWIISRNPLFLIFAQIISGFAWAGFNLSTSNFIYDITTPSKRIRCVSYFNTLIGLATCFGALLGGFIINKLPPIFGYKALTLFLISSIFRISINIFMSKNLKEVRSVENIDSLRLFSRVSGLERFLLRT